MSFFTILETVFIGPLKLIFEYIFWFSFKLLGHPGLAIIALSLAMNILVLPLYRRADAMQEASRDVEAKLSKGVSHIKKVFSGDERMMILQTYYRQNHYKPTDALKGSVSLLLEVPFFMAAYQFLSHASTLDGYSFGPIANLGAPDGLIVIGGIAINLLPVLMTLINVISSAIYLKGFPLKTKIQLYAMAAFFLVFLYESPSGLVFYWTLNNLFSLVKTIFYKLKNPKRVIMLLMVCAGIGALAFGLFFYQPPTLTRKLFVVGVGAVLALFPLISWAASKLPAPKTQATNRKLFVLGGVFLTILVGFLIPSTILAASPQEFVNLYNFYHPLLYILHTGCMAAGTFLVWLQVFYWLANPTGKVLFEKLLFILCGAMLVNYMFFGTNLGNLSPSLQFDLGLQFSSREILVNLAVLVAVCAGLLLVVTKWAKPVTAVLLTASIALGGMSAVNMISSGKAIDEIYTPNTDYTAEGTYFNLSKTGKNVVVIMLDRAQSQLIPYLFDEKPELQEQFEGFTLYDNTVSFSIHTNYAVPPLLGGYEYTPVEMNKRSDEALVNKHNEALKIMPALFSESGYQVTVCEPVYANYQWIPDLSIYDEYDNVNAYLTEGVFTPAEYSNDSVQSRSHNFFCYSIMKTMPLAVQPFIYESGNYNKIDSVSVQTMYTRSVAEGMPQEFLDSYLVLENLPEITGITNDAQNTFMMMINNTTHMPHILQEPDYTPVAYVDNSEYDAAHEDRFTNEHGTIVMDSILKMSHYHANMAAFLKIGQWLDYLRENDLYDNTRVILVSDHGVGLELDEDIISGTTDLSASCSLLMVKDFDSNGAFTTCSDFMTSADVPVLAMQELIENPVNPFTGKVIDSSEKFAHEQFVVLHGIWEITINNGNTFVPSSYASVKDDVRDVDNWTIYEGEHVPAEHRIP